jgi:hypothetical protein
MVLNGLKNKSMIVEICNYCNIYLGVVMVKGKACCQFCAEEQEQEQEQG